MKKFFFVLSCLVSMMTLNANAQSNDNVFFKCAMGQMKYINPDGGYTSGSVQAAKVIGTILESRVGQNTQKTNHPEFADAIDKAIASGINNARRFSVIDGGFSQDELNAHIPALYYDGTISSITTTRRINTNKCAGGKVSTNTQFMAEVVASFDIKDEYTGQIIKTMKINSSSYNIGWFASEEKALSSVIDKMQAQITKELDLAFPLNASIIEVKDGKGDKLKSVYVDLGTNAGANVGLYLLVERVYMIGGKKAKSELGRLRIQDVVGEEISLCKVTHGGKEIAAALAAGEPIVITSQNVSSWFGN